jgi:hypothetical protein
VKRWNVLQKETGPPVGDEPEMIVLIITVLKKMARNFLGNHQLQLPQAVFTCPSDTRAPA